MKLDIELFKSIAEKAKASPRLRMHYDLRDSEDENGQRMLNVLLPGTKTPIHRHTETSEVVVCIYGSAIERFYDADGKETAVVHMKAGSDIPGVVVEKGRFHSLEATDEMGVVCGMKAGKYLPMQSNDIINNISVH